MPPKRGRKTQSRQAPPRKRRAEEQAELVCLESGEEHVAAGNPFVNLLASSATPAAAAIEPFELPNEVIRCVNDDMALHVPPETCSKIWRGEYINLALLLKKDPQQERSSTVTLNEQGGLEVVAKPSRQIQNIREWTDAFLIYTSIFIKKFPTKAGELLQYMSTIREAGGRNAMSFGWKVYDENFRLRQAVNPASWATINVDLWLKTMTGFPAITNLVSRPMPKGSNLNANQASTQPCFDFNSSRGCKFQNCKYVHKCLICGGSHKQLRCPQNALKQNFRK